MDGERGGGKEKGVRREGGGRREEGGGKRGREMDECSTSAEQGRRVCGAELQ